MVDHPQLDARDMIERSDDAPPRIGFPARSTEMASGAGEALADQGEHTESLLSAVGYTAAELEELRQAGVVRY